MSDHVLRADAFRLPFASATFDVCFADLPYSGRNRAKRENGAERWARSSRAITL